MTDDAEGSATSRSIIDGVLAELQRWGPDRFSISDVANRTGLSAETIRAQYGDEENLVIAALARYARDTLTVPDTGSLRTDFESFALSVGAHLNSPLGRRLLRSLVVHDDRRTPGEVRSTFWRERLTDLTAMGRRAAERGELRDDVAPHEAVHFLISPLHVRALFSDVELDDDFCRRTAELAWRAVRPEPGISGANAENV